MSAGLDDAPMTSRLGRSVPLLGAGFAVLTAAADLVMGPNPDSAASTSTITRFYSTHHARISAGGMLLAYAAILFAFFGAAVWSRIRSTSLHPLVATAALVGTTVATAGQLIDATTYFNLGDIGHRHTTLPGALQAWHILGSELLMPEAGGVEILLLAVALAGILTHAFPRWLAWTALIIGLLQLTPISFLASLAFLLWAAGAGIAMSLRPVVDHDAPSRA